MVDVADTSEQDEIEMLDNLPDENRTIIQKCIQQLDVPVTTEEPLSLEQIVSVVNKEDEYDSDESAEETPCVRIID